MLEDCDNRIGKSWLCKQVVSFAILVLSDLEQNNVQGVFVTFPSTSACMYYASKMQSAGVALVVKLSEARVFLGGGFESANTEDRAMSLSILRPRLQCFSGSLLL